MWRILVSGASDLYNDSTVTTAVPRRWSLGHVHEDFLSVINKVKPTPAEERRERSVGGSF